MVVPPIIQHVALIKQVLAELLKYREYLLSKKHIQLGNEILWIIIKNNIPTIMKVNW